MKNSVYLDTTIISYLFDDWPELQSYVGVTLLPRTAEVEKAAEVYIQKLVMPNDIEGDAIHSSYKHTVGPLCT